MEGQLMYGDGKGGFSSDISLVAVRKKKFPPVRKSVFGLQVLVGGRLGECTLQDNGCPDMVDRRHHGDLGTCAKNYANCATYKMSVGGENVN